MTFDFVLFGIFLGWFMLIIAVPLGTMFSPWFFFLIPISLLVVLYTDYKYKVALFQKRKVRS